jgi:hypothetical protein
LSASNKSTSRSNVPISAGSTHQTDPTHQTDQTYWHRDEWDVALSDRGVYRIFRDRDTDAWFIDAIVD